MLIKGADIYQAGINDLRIEHGIITAIGALHPLSNEPVIHANGGALLPGLHDHHIHFLSFAASLASMDCSPAAVEDHNGLAHVLQQQAYGEGWLRGIGYHESVAGDIDCHWLDQHCPQRPVRIQHRTGRLWIFNSAGLAILKDAIQKQAVPPLLPAESLRSGRFYDLTEVLASLLGRHLPPVKQASALLATCGVTGFTDMTPPNQQDTFQLFTELKKQGVLRQNITLARRDASIVSPSSLVSAGPVKIHLHETHLPPLEELVERIHHAHKAGVPIAVHCVTEVELLFTLAALEEAGPRQGDRIEHASITPEHALERMQKMQLTVVTQPHFVQEKGDTYLQEIDRQEHNNLYRCQGFVQHGISLAGSSDAPFGSADPWAAMRAAVYRRTASGNTINPEEALTPEQALALFLGTAITPGQPRSIQTGSAADLCLLEYPWEIARTRLLKEDVRWVACGGETIFSKQIQTPSLTQPIARNNGVSS